MSGPDLILRSGRVVAPDGVRPGAIHIRGGRIVEVTGPDEVPGNARIEDYDDLVLLPGLVDTHVHVNEPGRADWEGFAAATRAAAAGGVTTLLDMPLNSIPATTTVAALAAKREAAAGQCVVDLGFWGGLVPDNESELAALHDAGVFGFKCFLVPSGVPEFQHVDEATLRRALKVTAGLGVPVLVHAELPDRIREPASSPAGPAAEDGRRYASYLASRPAEAETAAVKMLVRLCRQTGARVHVVHVSAAETVAALRAARRRGPGVSAETCPHYLYFAAEGVGDGATEFKCAPPIRDRANRDGLWGALADGVLDLVVSDHSPCPAELKRREEGDFFAAWGGITSLQVALPAMWTAARARGHGFAELAEWMSRAPARLAALDGRKGALAPGLDADVVVWDPDAEHLVRPERLQHRHPITPYAGERLAGEVEATYVCGEKVWERGRVLGEPRGRLLSRMDPAPVE